MKVLVIGGTGKVGTPLVAELVNRGVKVRVLTRSLDRASSLPAGVQPFVGDIVADPEATAAAFRGVDAVFMLNAASAQETVEGLLAVELALAAGVRRFVYQSVHRLDDLAHLPHVAAKLVIGRALARSGMDYTLICPNHFYQNDEECQYGLIKANLYVQPIGEVGCWRVDTRDVAEAAAIVLTSQGHGGQTYNLVGPGLLTGEACAAAWSKAFGREIRYVGDVVVWQDGVKPFIPAWLTYDLALMYRGFAQQGMLGEADDVARLTKLLGRPPRPYQAYVDERAAAWSQVELAS
jgi:uncharacterized protein YbjT (DUF2867 family)